MFKIKFLETTLAPDVCWRKNNEIFLILPPTEIAVSRRDERTTIRETVIDVKVFDGSSFSLR